MRAYWRGAFLVALTLCALSSSAQETPHSVEFDQRLQAHVYTRPDLQGKWRPQKSALGFHISKFLGGSTLPADVQERLDKSILGAETPQYRDPLKFVINYADSCCEQAQKANCLSALARMADVCIAYRRESLGDMFVKRNARLLGSKTGAGFWVWKPYLIFKTLWEVQDGDMILYSDFTATFKQNLVPLFLLPERLGQPAVFFAHPEGEEGGPRTWSKGDVLVILDCYNNTCTEEAKHITAAVSVWRKSEEASLLSSYWMSYMEDPRVSSDMEDTLGFPNEAFRQGEPQEVAVASLIAYRWKINPSPRETAQDFVSL